MFGIEWLVKGWMAAARIGVTSTSASYPDTVRPWVNVTQFSFEDMRGAGEFEAEDYV